MKKLFLLSGLLFSSTLVFGQNSKYFGIKNVFKKDEKSFFYKEGEKYRFPFSLNGLTNLCRFAEKTKKEDVVCSENKYINLISPMGTPYTPLIVPIN